MTPADLAELFGLPELPRALEAVETELDRAIVVERAEIEDPARRVVLGGGKRLRPGLALACAVAASGRGGHVVGDPSVVLGATSVELVQAGSLVHDDIMDEAGERRGVPTINSVEGPSQALLVGDFLLARAGQLAAGVNQSVAAFLATAIADLCIGQSAEVSTLFSAERTQAAYEDSIRGKTAALFRASCEIGAAAIEAPAAGHRRGGGLRDRLRDGLPGDRRRARPGLHAPRPWASRSATTSARASTACPC